MVIGRRRLGIGEKLSIDEGLVDGDHVGLKYDIGVWATAIGLGIVAVKVVRLRDGLGIGLGDGLGIISEGLGIDEGQVDGDHVGLKYHIGVGAAQVAAGLVVVGIKVGVIR